MTLAVFEEYVRSLAGVTLEFPFDETTLVCKVMGKMFALTDITTCAMISVKCDPDDALAIREAYAGVIPGYHLNKRHWNSIANDGRIPDEQIFSWIADSYALVLRKLPARDRARLV